MTALEIVTLVLICVGAASALGFVIAGIVTMYTEKKVKLPKATVTKIYEEETVAQEVEEPVQDTEIDIDQMLARLEARKEEAENAVEEEAVVEEPVQEEVAEEVEEIAIPEMVEENAVVETVVEEVEEETVVEEPVQKEVVEQKDVINPVVEEDKFDYKTRLEKIKESQEKIERDLEKTQKAINKYERTERRRARNQKLLDKKATELTNLNLVMYSVTDIKNVDVEKKAKQEELTAHISELKASIQDAEEDLAKNESKYQNNVKLLEYLKNEKHRYEEEVKELEKMLEKAGK